MKSQRRRCRCGCRIVDRSRGHAARRQRTPVEEQALCSGSAGHKTHYTCHTCPPDPPNGPAFDPRALRPTYLEIFDENVDDATRHYPDGRSGKQRMASAGALTAGYGRGRFVFRARLLMATISEAICRQPEALRIAGRRACSQYCWRNISIPIKTFSGFYTLNSTCLFQKNRSILLS